MLLGTVPWGVLLGHSLWAALWGLAQGLWGLSQGLKPPALPHQPWAEPSGCLSYGIWIWGAPSSWGYGNTPVRPGVVLVPDQGDWQLLGSERISSQPSLALWQLLWGQEYLSLLQPCAQRL